MGELHWGKESPSNINEGGNFRREGDPEIDILKAKGLSEPEIEVREKVEILDENELRKIENLLAENNLRASDFLGSQNMKDWVHKQLPAVRYLKLDQHMKTLANKEEALRIKKQAAR